MSTVQDVERLVGRRKFLSPRIDLNGRTILITGGTGSFGRRFVRTVCEQFTPRKVIVFSRDELKQYEMQQELGDGRWPFLRFLIGDVRDAARLETAMRGVDYVVHAAALKHVSVAEYNPFECIQTNVYGAQNVVTAAIRAGVTRVVALSTDKAASPINLYGASKLAADKIFCAAAAMAGDSGTTFSVVRYGNVVGSRGSVIPYFERLAASGAKRLPITDARMTRFWITLDQAVAFVLSSLEMMQGSEIFVPKIMSMSMVDLARLMAPHIAQEIVGIRAGEKLHELMITHDDARCTVERDDRYVIIPADGTHRRALHLLSGAVPVREDFAYASDSNPERLDARGLQALVGQAFTAAA